MNAFSERALQAESDSLNRGDLQSIAAILSGRVEGRCIRCPSPGRSLDDRSCHVLIDPARPDKFFIYDCEGPKATAYASVRARLKLAARPMSTSRSDFARRVWEQTSSATGTLVQTYLSSRAITILPPANLHFHPQLPHNPSRSSWPAMVAARTSVDGRLVAVHRTYLAHDGSGKAPVDPQRMDLGPAHESAIRLAPIAAELMIGEGIETTLSAMQATGRPGWAAGSASALRAMALPPTVCAVVLLVDGDDAGEAATKAAAMRWLSEGRRVRLARAPAGKDFNDLLIEEAVA
jgi:hypothetical protein